VLNEPKLIICFGGSFVREFFHLRPYLRVWAKTE
jgi:hypothetical protein